MFNSWHFFFRVRLYKGEIPTFAIHDWPCTFMYIPHRMGWDRWRPSGDPNLEMLSLPGFRMLKSYALLSNMNSFDYWYSIPALKLNVQFCCQQISLFNLETGSTLFHLSFVEPWLMEFLNSWSKWLSITNYIHLYYSASLLI